MTTSIDHRLAPATAPGRRARVIFLIALTAVCALIAAVLPRIPQDPKYYQFADHRAFLGVPNFFDVASNAGFLVVGVLGLALLARGRSALFADPRERAPYWVFFASIALVSLGSTYHHLAPDVYRLFWDRLPMAVAFVAFLAAVVAERVSVTAGARLLWPLVLLGAGSTIYWRWTEQQGAGDLRLYGFVQFFPLLAVPLIALLFPSRYTRGGDLWLVLLLYGLAKLAELLDPQILAGTGGAVSGHTLKHVLAAWALVWVVRSLRERRAVAL
ncbi:MAG TPA: hypothetical protein VKA84_01610 [Gemmatimonadaceae bacterium]|nr:hypothetical protein [Gemmatimonadaceae bacterium]